MLSNIQCAKHGQPRFLFGLIICIWQCCCNAVPAMEMGTTVVEQESSIWLKLDDNKQLVYHQDKLGNRIPDFSYVGYRSGEQPLPQVPVLITLEPSKNVKTDDTKRIQAALDALAQRPINGRHRGAVLLKKGSYRIEGSLRISASGIVLRGEGDGTKLIAVGYTKPEHKRTVITVGPVKDGPDFELSETQRSSVTDEYVPIGSMQIQVADGGIFSVGDSVVVFRPSTNAWLQDIGCTTIPARWGAVRNTKWVTKGDHRGFYYERDGISDPQMYKFLNDESWEDYQKRVAKNLRKKGKELNFTQQWQAGEYDMYYERKVQAINGKQITLHAPLPHAMKRSQGQSELCVFTRHNRIEECGVESLQIISEFAPPTKGHPYGDPKKMTSAEKHAWNGIVLLKNTEHCWVRNITGQYLGWSLVSVRGKHATVRDCANLNHASVISGGRRYSFMIDGQLNLVQRCFTRTGRHEFVVQARAWGPNVFVDCLGVESKSCVGPHHRYSVGTLFDNISSEYYMESCWRGNSGTGHGWSAAQTVYFNCQAPRFKVNTPVGTYAWVLGCARKKHFQKKKLPIKSLYYQQLRDRLGDEALSWSCSKKQLEELGTFEWAKGISVK